MITGHGLKVDKTHEIAEGVLVSPSVPSLNELGLNACDSLKERAAIETMHEIASFSIEVHDERGGKELATKGWNRLWDFHLLSLASKAPCFILYSVSDGKVGTTYAVANRNLIINPLPKLRPLTNEALEWASENEPNFRSLMASQQFLSAMRYFGNSHYLFDLEHRIMLLWAGIEGLLQVESEHNRRIALYSAILTNGTDHDKFLRFEMVKRSYSLRSRVVHGAKPTPAKLERGYAEATELLAELLARCVELGRVPSREELDRASIQVHL